MFSNKIKNNQFQTFIAYKTVNNGYNRLVLCTTPELVSAYREQVVSVCVGGIVAIPEPKQSSIPECSGILGYVHSLFNQDSPTHVQLDSYPVTLLAKVDAELPPVADSLALHELYAV